MSAGPAIRAVPADAATRSAIRRCAAELVAAQPPDALDRAALAMIAQQVLQRLGLPEAQLGFAMVAVASAAWLPAFAATPLQRRLLLLPHCLRHVASCRAGGGADGLHCAGCGSCDIPTLTHRAEALGYRVIVAEGASAISEEIIGGGRDAVLGVACLESLDLSFERVTALGLPHVAVPLTSDGCADTTVDQDELFRLLGAVAAPATGGQRGFLPLLRLASRLGDADRLDTLLGPVPTLPGPAAVEAMARAQLTGGGKRLRPFCVLAAYAARRHGMAALDGATDVEALCPPAMRRLALAVECMHKASLAHDDIQDAARSRYGRPAPHIEHGLDLAINLGDHLLGIGYTQVAAAGAELGAAVAADGLALLAEAHRDLCLGQGAELLARRDLASAGPLDVLDIAARKTAPAFHAALGLGLRAAGPLPDGEALRRFTRHLGTCFQIIDDLEDWDGDDAEAGADLAAGQPTVLSAFAVEAGRGAELVRLRRELQGVELAAAGRRLYHECAAFSRAATLVERLRERALATVDEVPGPAVQELLRFLVRLACPPRAS